MREGSALALGEEGSATLQTKSEVVVNTILVPVDFSDCSHKLVREALATAQAEGAKLRILHVLEPAPRNPEAQITFRGVRRSVTQHLRAEAEAQLKEYEPLLAEIESELLLVEGEPVPAILKAAEAEDISKVIMMTRARTGFMRLLYGSVTEAVQKKIAKPLVVLRTEYKESCAAGSCATCVSGVGEARFQSRAEEDG